MNLTKDLEQVKLELQIAPLIDVVFLLLIYFMVTASLVKKEGDISFILPASIPQKEIVAVPVEVQIEIDADGTVVIEGMQFQKGDVLLNGMVTQIMGLRQMAASQKSPFFVTLLPDNHARHRRIINVMDACAAAGVESLTFSKGT